jgi:hypothetical protein
MRRRCLITSGRPKRHASPSKHRLALRHRPVFASAQSIGDAPIDIGQVRQCRPARPVADVRTPCHRHQIGPVAAITGLKAGLASWLRGRDPRLQRVRPQGHMAKVFAERVVLVPQVRREAGREFGRKCRLCCCKRTEHCGEVWLVIHGRCAGSHKACHHLVTVLQPQRAEDTSGSVFLAGDSKRGSQPCSRDHLRRVLRGPLLRRHSGSRKSHCWWVNGHCYRC